MEWSNDFFDGKCRSIILFRLFIFIFIFLSHISGREYLQGFFDFTYRYEMLNEELIKLLYAVRIYTVLCALRFGLWFWRCIAITWSNLNLDNLWTSFTFGNLHFNIKFQKSSIPIAQMSSTTKIRARVCTYFVSLLRGVVSLQTITHQKRSRSPSPTIYRSTYNYKQAAGPHAFQSMK